MEKKQHLLQFVLSLAEYSHYIKNNLTKSCTDNLSMQKRRNSRDIFVFSVHIIIEMTCISKKRVNFGHLICFLHFLKIYPPGVSADLNFPQPNLSFDTKICWYSTFLAQRFYFKVVFLGVKMSDTKSIIFTCMSLYSYKQHFFLKNYIMPRTKSIQPIYMPQYITRNELSNRTYTWGFDKWPIRKIRLDYPSTYK